MNVKTLSKDDMTLQSTNSEISAWENVMKLAANGNKSAYKEKEE